VVGGLGPGSPIVVLRSSNVGGQVSTVDDADPVTGLPGRERAHRAEEPFMVDPVERRRQVRGQVLWRGVFRG
jgi:hypothetical protein